MPLTLTGINRFPIKSCRGEAATSAVVEPWGLAGDRRWMVVGPDGEAITAREVHPMLLVRPELVDGGLVVAAPGLPDLRIDQPRGADLAVSVHGKPLRAALADEAAHRWFSQAVGREARLVYLDDPTGRPTNARFSQPGDRVMFADGYPVHLTSEASLAVLNEWVAAESRPDQGPLPMLRFRPNLVVGGDLAPWAEDGWRRVRIGAAEFRVVKGCDRCVMTTLDPDTAAAGQEPIATLARHRRFDAATWFGMDLIADTPGVTIQIGDEISVITAVAAPNGPPR